MDGGAVITVADDGRGFPEHLLDHAFERFRRADGARGRDAGASTGLGLAIVAAIAQAHGGTVRAGNGGPYGGAVVTLTLPP
jgi:signal transduction histidine kinase